MQLIGDVTERRIRACLVACESFTTDELEAHGLLESLRFEVAEVKATNTELARLLRIAKDHLTDDRNSGALAVMIDAYLSHIAGRPDKPERRAWSAVESGALRRLAGRMPAAQIAKTMGRTVCSIHQQAHALGVSLTIHRERKRSTSKAPSKAKKVTVKARERQQIRALADEGLDVAAISDRLSIAEISVSKALKSRKPKAADPVPTPVASVTDASKAIKAHVQPEQPVRVVSLTDGLNGVRHMTQRTGAWNMRLVGVLST